MLAKIAGLIEEAAFAPESFDHGLAQVAHALGFDHGALVYSELDVPNYVAAAETMAGLTAYANEGWLSVDYRAPYIDPFPIGKIFADNLHVPDEHRLTSDIYHTLYKRHDMSNYVGWKSAIDDSVWIYTVSPVLALRPSRCAGRQGAPLYTAGGSHL